MRRFDYKKLADEQWDNEVLSLISQIQEYKGRQELYIRQKPMELSRLVEIAKIQSAEASNRIEGIVTTKPRLRQLMADKTLPRNRDEQEIMGYRKVLSLIHESYEYIPVQPNYILQLHRDLLSLTKLSFGGAFKTTRNEIVMMMADGTQATMFRPLEPHETPAAVARLCNTFHKALANEITHPLVLMSCFILDFLCIHPFNDGNGRMSRLLTLLIMYQSGFMIGKYISLEKIIEDTKESYYSALQQSDKDWHTGKNNIRPFVKYMLQVILRCYQQFEERVKITGQAGVKSTAYDIVKHYAEEKLGQFSKQEVLVNCPGIGRSSAEAALKRLLEEGVIERHGTGRSTYYVRR